MSGYMTYLMVEAQQTELAERVRRARPLDDARIGRPDPSRLRTWTARLLPPLAMRLDNRLQPATARVAPSGART